MVEHPNNHFPNIPKQGNNSVNSEDENMETEDDTNFGDLSELDFENLFPESEELESIDNQLDELNSALDYIEKKNDNILAELTQLLHENREIRKQLQEVRSGNTVENVGEDPKKSTREKN